MENFQNLYSETDVLIDRKERIGKGIFGEVFKATIKKSNKRVAVKIILEDKKYKDREISIMQELNHPNIIKLYSSYNTISYQIKNNDKIYHNIIMEYMPQTLSKILIFNLKNKIHLPLIIIKLLSFQLLKSLGYLKSLNIIHRDIKPENILINPFDFTLKICDFGNAKHLNLNENNSFYVCNRYYRAPELILGSREYKYEIDMWSAGCVICQLVTNYPLFMGKNSRMQLIEIIKILGSPNEHQLKEMNPKINFKNKFPFIYPRDWKSIFHNKINDENFFDLISKILVYEPNKRIQPYEALLHPFFNDLKNNKFFTFNGKNISYPNHLFIFNQFEYKNNKENIEKLMHQVHNSININ